MFQPMWYDLGKLFQQSVFGLYTEGYTSSWGEWEMCQV